MSLHAIRWTRRASRRLDLVGQFIEKDNPAAAGQVVARIVSAIDRLTEQPNIGRPGRIKGTRELVFADIPYIAVDRVNTSAI